ncbi:MAG: DUF3943 domain-containing protein [Kofleriaceae bacterium]
MRIAIAILVALANPARADDVHWLQLGAGTAGVMGAGQAWYWRDGASASRGDWALPGNWSAITDKLSLDGVRFDPDGFDTNALKHPLFGTTAYTLGRFSGLSPLGSFAYASALSLVWETFGEWREYASINDLLATSTSGVPIGEALYQIVRDPRAARYELRLGTGTIETGAGERFDASVEANGSRIAISIPFDRSGPRARDILARSELGRIATQFRYHYLLGETWDLWANVQAGPTFARRADHVTIGVDTGASFAMLRSFAFDAWRAEHPNDVVRGVLRNGHPYYYGAGLVVAPRVDYADDHVVAGAELSTAIYRSLDGHDRFASDALQLVDTETFARAYIGAVAGHAIVRLDTSLRHRGSAIGTCHGGYDEHAIVVSVGVRI